MSSNNNPFFNLLCCDALGTTVGIRYKGYNTTRSKFGGIMSIFMIIVTLTTIAFFGNMYLSGSQVSMMNNIIKFWNSQNITLNSDFKLGFSNQYGGKQMFRDDIWQITAAYVTTNSTNSQVSQKPLSKYPCNVDEWNGVESQFNLMKMNQALCINTNNLTLEGNYNTEIFSFISITWTLVANITDPTINTKLSSEIGTLMPLATLFVKEGMTSLNGKNLVTTNYINAINVNLTYGNIKDIEVQLSNEEYNMSLDRILFTDKVIKNIFVVNRVQEKISVRPAAFTKSFTFIIDTSNTKNISSIYFMSFSDMLARIGAIVQNILTICLLITYLKTYWSCENDHYNDIAQRICDDLSRCSGKYAASIDKLTKLERTNFASINTEGIVKENDILNINEQSQEPYVYNMSKIKVNLNNLNKKDIENKVDNQNLKSRESSSISNKALKEQEIPSSSVRKIFKFKQSINENDDINYAKIIDNLSHSINPLKSKSNDVLLMEIIQNINSSGTISFSFMSYFYNKYFSYFTCCKNYRSQLNIFNFINNYLNSALEVYNIEKRYFQFELLKYILLNTQQVDLFEKIPLLSGASVINQIEKLGNEKTLRSKFKTTTKELESLSNEDKKLYGLFIDEFEKINRK